MYYYDRLHPDQCRGEDLDALLSLGWYPMGQTVFTTSHLFRDDDSSPPQVHWLRFPVHNIADRSSHKRIRRKNTSFKRVQISPFKHEQSLDELYRKYLDSINFDGYSSVEDATFARGEENIYRTTAILVYDQDKPVSCGIFHVGADSVASVLHFFDPLYKKFSPGKYLMLSTIDYCRDRGLAWYYPGYVIGGNPKMDYKLFLGKDKAQYYSPEPHPLSGRWLPFSEEILDGN